MTVREFTRSYFGMNSYTRKLEIRVKGVGWKLYSGEIDSEIFMLPQVREMEIETWTIHNKKIMVWVNSTKDFMELVTELRIKGELK